MKFYIAFKELGIEGKSFIVIKLTLKETDNRVVVLNKFNVQDGFNTRRFFLIDTV